MYKRLNSTGTLIQGTTTQAPREIETLDFTGHRAGSAKPNGSIGGAKRMRRTENFHGTLYGTPHKCHPGKSLIGRAKLRTGAASSDYS